MFLFGRTLLPLLVTLLLERLCIASAYTKAYLYYKDAECTSGSKISGTLVYAYNDSRMKGKGFTKKNYHGPCKYFEGGFYDFMYSSNDDGSYMQSGYCIRCNGMVGCTDTRYSCAGFHTVMPTIAYTMSQNSTISDDETTSMYDTPEEMVDIDVAEENVYAEISQYVENESSGLNAIIGVFLGMCSMGTIQYLSRAIRRSKKKNIIVDIDNASNSTLETKYNGEAMT